MVALNIRAANAVGLFAAQQGNSPEVQYFPLTLLSPRAAGTAGVGGGTGLSSNDRIFFACTGKEYAIPVSAVGGVFPYTVTLSNAPAGMVAEKYTSADGTKMWRIRWPNPTSTASNITVRVTDALNSFVEGTWSITVGTSGWNFVDSNNSAGGRNGTEANPWNSLVELRNNAAPSSRSYLRGTFTLTSTSSGGAWFNNMDFNDNATSVVWMPYPGESYTINGQSVGDSNTVIAQFNHTGGSNSCPPWIEGGIWQNFGDKCINMGHYNGHGWTVYKNTFQDLGPAVDLFNSGAINQRDFGNGGVNPQVRHGCRILDNTFRRLGDYAAPGGQDGNIGLKGYSLSTLLIEGNLVRDTGEHQEAFFAMKADTPNFFVRRNKAITNFNMPLVGGNMNTYNDGLHESSGEIGYNNVAGGGSFGGGLTDCLLEYNHDGKSRTIVTVRNTVQGQCYFEGVDSADGPFTQIHNVFINGDGARTKAFQYDFNVSSFPRITVTENLGAASASGILDANGLLTGQSRIDFLGTRGHEIPGFDT